MSVLDVANEVAAVVGVTQFNSLFAADIQPRTQLEFRSLLNEMAQRIAYDTREWTALKRIYTFTGDGIAQGFNLPANYQRMLLTSQVYSTATPSIPLVFIADTNDWVQRRLRNITDGRGEWTLMGTQMLIYPTLPAGAQVTFAYLDKNCVGDALLTSFNDTFSSDTDRFRLPERLLKLGAIWQWKANKGSPYAEDMGTYSDALMNVMGADKPAPIMIDRLPLSAATNVALPWPVPT